jgi:hypothetical protein
MKLGRVKFIFFSEDPFMVLNKQKQLSTITYELIIRKYLQYLELSVQSMIFCSDNDTKSPVFMQWWASSEPVLENA